MQLMIARVAWVGDSEPTVPVRSTPWDRPSAVSEQNRARDAQLVVDAVAGAILRIALEQPTSHSR
jgi:hypothetical protein